MTGNQAARNVIDLGEYRRRTESLASRSRPEDQRDHDEYPGSADSSGELREFLIALRAGANAATYPVPAYDRRRGGDLGVAQWQVAGVLGLTSRSYRSLERSENGRTWSRQQVDQLADSFDLDWLQRAALYRLALGYNPVHHPDQAEKRAAADFVDALAYPAHVLDSVFVIEHRNSAHAAWLPELQERENWARWVLTSRAARRRLRNWHFGWARPLLAALHQTLSSPIGAQRDVLENLIDQACDVNPDVRVIWQARHTLEPPARNVRTIQTPFGPRRITEWSGGVHTASLPAITVYLPATRAGAPSATVQLGASALPAAA